MKELGANAIRVYHVDPDGDHDGCMQAFADNGIYLMVDLDDFDTDIDPKGAVWTTSQYNAFARNFDAFAKYTNTLGVFVGNEVIARANQSEAAPFIKAAARDMKAYRDQKGYRKIPVGYSAADIAELRPMLQDYLACGANSSEAIDFFGLNAYEWCNPTDTFETSGYIKLNQMTEGYPLPIFFSETGCNTNRPRLFLDQEAILGDQMSHIWSGTIVYEWIEEMNNYGLISYAEPVGPTATGKDIYDGFVRKGTPTPVQPDFSNLQAVWKTLTPTGTPSSKYTPSVTTIACPASTVDGWLVDGDVNIPRQNDVLTIHATLTSSNTNSPPSTTATNVPSTTTPAAAATSTGGAGTLTDMRLTGCAGALIAVMLGFTIWL
jgi:hypothetical protein